MLERHDNSRQRLRGFPEARLRQRIARTQVLVVDDQPHVTIALEAAIRAEARRRGASGTLRDSTSE
jgi:hypothetical protein